MIATITRIDRAQEIADAAPEGCVTSAHIVDIAGISYRQLDYWTRTDLLHPIPRPRIGHGTGTPRYYPADQVARATTLRLLLDAGISLQTCRQVIDELLEVGAVRIGAFTIHLPTEP